MSDTTKLFKVTTAGHREFYVVAEDHADAADAVEAAWERWGYVREKGHAITVEIVAERGQYRDITLSTQLPYLVDTP